MLLKGICPRGLDSNDASSTQDVIDILLSSMRYPYRIYFNERLFYALLEYPHAYSFFDQYVLEPQLVRFSSIYTVPFAIFEYGYQFSQERVFLEKNLFTWHVNVN